MRPAGPTIDAPAEVNAAGGSAPTGSAPRRRLDPRLVAPAVLAGAVLRAAALSGALGRTDSDEVLPGLMARHLAGDGWPVFLWGQSYGGSIQLGPVALSTVVFGTTSVGLRLPVIAIAVANSLLVWRVARRLVTAPQAQVAGLLSWLGPPTALWYGVREMLFYQPTVLFGLVTTLFVLRITGPDPAPARHARHRDWAIAGAAAGLGWWTSPNIVYLVIPAVVVLIVHRRRWWPAGGGRALLVAGAAATAGALPWIAVNIIDPLESFGASGFPVHGNYLTRLAWFGWFGLPGALGLRETFTYDWIAGPAGLVAGLAATAALALAWWRAARARPWRWDAIALVTYPLLFALIPFGPDQPNMKYQFFLTPVLAVTLARLARSPCSAAVLLTLTVAVTALGLPRISAAAHRDATPLLMPDLDAAIAALDRRGITAVWGDYWIVYRIAWHTGERVIGSPAVGLRRYTPYEDAARAATRSAWVVERGPDEAALRRDLARLDVAFTADDAGAYVVVVPERPVLPGELHAARDLGR